VVNSGDEPDRIDKTRVEHDLRTRQHRRTGFILLLAFITGLVVRHLWGGWP